MRRALLEARKRNGFSVKEIAGRLGISASSYYKIEKGNRNPTLALAQRIAELLKEDISALFFDQLLDNSSNRCEPTGTEGGHHF